MGISSRRPCPTVFLGLALLGCGSSPAANPNAPPASPPGNLPSVLSADGHLDCTISSKENGTQKLVLRTGQGIEFDVAVSPIVDGVVRV